LTWSILDDEENIPTFIVDQISQLAYPVAKVVKSDNELTDLLEHSGFHSSVSLNSEIEVSIHQSILVSICDRMIS
jgi:hypothetical protein